MERRTERVQWIIVLVLCSSRGTCAEESCDLPLVSGLPPSSFSSSSHLSNSHSAGFAKLNRRDGAGGWSPLTSDQSQWLEVDLGQRTTISALATQGRYGSSDWLSSYLLMFSDTGHNWRQYRPEDMAGSFPGNSNADSMVQNKLQQSAVARFLRLVPLDWNPSGRIGLRLEVYGCPYTSSVMGLDGSSVVYRLRPEPKTRSGSREVLSLKFKTMRNSGTLLWLQDQDLDRPGLSLELDKGTLLLIITGSGPRSQRGLGSLLDDQHWHQVRVERLGSELNFTVDRQTESILLPPEFSRWDVPQLSVGAVHSSTSQRPSVSRGHFQGCVENLVFNDQNLIKLAQEQDQQVSVQGHVTFSCSEPISIAVTFSGTHSFLWLPRPMGTEGAASVGFQFRTWDEAGLLLTFDLSGEGGVAQLQLREARLRLQLQTGGRSLLDISVGSELNDGEWHVVTLSSEGGHVTLSVDEDVHQSSTSISLSSDTHFFFGSCPTAGDGGGCTNPSMVFQGCMRLISLDRQPVDLILVQQRRLGNYSQLQIDVCGIIDRCSPSRCEHGGRCSQSWTGFSCNCSGTGYDGATCHSSLYEASCEAYKHSGATLGHFYIDVDGSGPIRPQLVYCNMTEDEVWMTLRHNDTDLTRLRPSAGVTHSSVHFHYSVQEEALLAIIGQSEHCQQEVSYQCRKSRLLHSPEGPGLSWWVGGPGPGRLQTHWAGAEAGSQQCACGLERRCVEPQLHCNCDARREHWAEDSGLVTQKESLPVRSLVLGDVHSPGSEAAYRVGPLQCHGDKNLWNSVFFDKDTSYLHFPTFQAELSADVSFFFKTSSSSGLFLENLGIRDFIRIELRSPSEVLFSLDVGDGPLEVSVRSDVPLNDDRWHRVRAERNVKEVSLRVDGLPVAFYRAPANGHLHLQLNSQLFIGGTASRQRGFRGCIRSLQMNGVTLDLEQRAKVTPGVQAGCPGHCSSYGMLCQNQGRCVEQDTGFTCDCGHSAFNGLYCHKELSALFSPETSVSYTFPAPAELTQNYSSRSWSESALRGQNLSLSFRTVQSPSLLLLLTSHSRQYLALILHSHHQLEVQYSLNSSRDTELFRSRVRSLSNGQLHRVSLRRREQALTLQIDQNAEEHFNLTSEEEFGAVKSLFLGRVQDVHFLDSELSRLASVGFSGCLSVVLFNSISPLKAALLQPHTSPVSVSGPLLQSDCGSSASANQHAAENRHLPDRSGTLGSGQPLVNTVRTDPALIGGVIALVIFVLVSLLAITGRVLYRRKETYRNREVIKQEDSQDLSFNTQPESQDGSGEHLPERDRV